MHLHNFIKIHRLVNKILSINEISISFKGHNSVAKERKILSISMHIQNLIEIYKLILKTLNIIEILTSIKGHNSVKIDQKKTCIRYNMDLVYINEYTKNYRNSSIVLKILRKNKCCNNTLPPFSVLCRPQSQNLSPVYSLMLSFRFFVCLPLLFDPFTVPCRIVFSMPKDLEMWPYHLTFRFSTMPRRSSCAPVMALGAS